MNTNPYEAPNADAVQTQFRVHTATLHSIPFLTYLLLNACIGFSSGILVGIGAIIFSPTGAFDVVQGNFELRGIAAGFLVLLVFPLYFSTVLVLLSLLGYFPFRVLFRWIGQKRFRIVIQDNSR